MDILCLYVSATRKKHAILQVVYQKNVTLSPLTDSETTLSFRPFQSNSIELARKSSVPSVVTYVGLAPTGCGLFKSMADRCWINVDLQWVFQRSWGTLEEGRPVSRIASPQRFSVSRHTRKKHVFPSFSLKKIWAPTAPHFSEDSPSHFPEFTYFLFQRRSGRQKIHLYNTNFMLKDRFPILPLCYPSPTKNFNGHVSNVNNFLVKKKVGSC